MAKVKEIGPYSAYAIAVKYGYQGTEEEWVQEQEANRKAAEAAAAAAAQSAKDAAASASGATQSGQQAVQSIKDAQTSAVQAVDTAKQQAVQAAQAVAEKAASSAAEAAQSATNAAAEVGKVQSAGTSAVQSVQAAQNTATEAVSAAQQTATQAVSQAQTAAVSAVQEAGTAQVSAVGTAGADAVEDVNDAKTAALEAIDAANAALPSPTQSDAGKVPTVKADASAYELAGPYAPLSAAIRPAASGNPVIITDSVEWPLQGLKVYGKSTQDGTPSPENPVPIVSAGDGGSISISVKTNQLFNKENVEFIRAELKNGLYFISKDHVLDSSIIMDNSFINFNKDDKFTVTFKAKSTVDGDRIYYDIYPDEYGDGGHTALTTEYKECSYTMTTSKAGNSANFRFYSKKTYRNGDISIIPESVMLNRGKSVLPWELYRFQSLEISTPNGLPGIPVKSGGNYTDEDGQQLVCDVKDYGAGIKTQNSTSIIFDGSSDERWNQNEQGIFINLDPPAKNAVKGTAICSIAIPCGGYAELETGQLGVRPTASGNLLGFFFYNNQQPTLEEWKNQLSQTPIQVLYILFAPITTSLSEEEIAAYQALHTYDGATVVSTAENVAGLEVKYLADGEKYVERIVSQKAPEAAAAHTMALLADGIREGVNGV